jgi:hypothetical protein
MDSELHIQLEELPDADAVETAREAIQKTLAEGGSTLASLQWDMFQPQITKALRDALANYDWLNALAGVWCTASQLRKLAEETKDAGTSKPYPIGAHPLALDLHPVVSLRCGPIAFPALRFTVKLVAEVQCAILIISAGRLRAVDATELSLSATLFYGAHRLGKLASRKVALTSPHSLPGEGWPIVAEQTSA